MNLPQNVSVRSLLARGHDGYSLEDEEAIAALFVAEDAHFWHLSRNRFISKRLHKLGFPAPARVLELGCGGGCVSAHLARQGFRVTGVDGHLSRVIQAAHRAPQATFVVHDLSKGLSELGGEMFDVVALFDVIEHLDDPRSVLEQAASRLAPGGILVGTVPSMMALWSDVDRRSGHRLRYERPGLEELLRGLGNMEVAEVRPFNRMLIPLVWLQRKAVGGPDSLERGLEVPAAPVNASLLALLGLEYRLSAVLDRIGFPGASLWFALRARR